LYAITVISNVRAIDSVNCRCIMAPKYDDAAVDRTDVYTVDSSVKTYERMFGIERVKQLFSRETGANLSPHTTIDAPDVL
jgi:hypothetical protein